MIPSQQIASFYQGAPYANTQIVLQNFILLLQEAAKAERSAEFSDHPSA